MNLKNLTAVLSSGNIALGSKLANLLTEDCVILEYTDNSVLFIKGGNLAKASFKVPVNESVSAASFTEAEVINISARELNAELSKKLRSVVEGVAYGDFLAAEEKLNEFCESYYQFHTLKTRVPEVFTENLVKNTKGFQVRKKAMAQVPAFKSKVFDTIVVEEASVSDAAALTSLVESNGLVLALGKARVKSYVTDALLGNTVLAEYVVNNLYSICENLEDTNPELEKLGDDNYDFETGGFPEEGPVDPDEDLSASDDLDIPEIEDTPEDGEGTPEFEPFDPSMLSEEETKELHRATLRGILSAIKEFVVEKANSIDDTNIPPDLDEKIAADLDALTDPELSDARLSEIEARWEPMIGHFLDSEYHTPESIIDEFGGDTDIDTSIPGGDDSERISDMDTNLGDDASGEGDDLPGMGGEELPGENPNPEEDPLNGVQ